GPALGKVRIGAKHSPEVGRRHRGQIGGDLPGREEPQRLCSGCVMTPADKVLPSLGTEAGERVEITRRDRWTDLGKCFIGIDVEIGGRGLFEGLSHAACLDIPGFYLCTTIPRTCDGKWYITAVFLVFQSVHLLL